MLRFFIIDMATTSSRIENRDVTTDHVTCDVRKSNTAGSSCRHDFYTYELNELKHKTLLLF